MDHPSVLKPIVPRNLSEKDIEIFKEMLTHDPGGRTVLSVCEDIMKATSLLLKWDEEEGRGLMVCCVLNRGAFTELYVDILGGTGYIKLIDKICEDLRFIAKSLGCKQVGALAQKEAFAKFHEKRGWVPMGTYGVMQVEE